MLQFVEADSKWISVGDDARFDFDINDVFAFSLWLNDTKDYSINTNCSFFISKRDPVSFIGYSLEFRRFDSTRVDISFITQTGSGIYQYTHRMLISQIKRTSHLIVLFDSTLGKTSFFLNEKLLEEVTLNPAGSMLNVAPFQFGKSGTINEYLDGIFNNFVVFKFSATKTLSEIQAMATSLFNLGGVVHSSLHEFVVGHWPLTQINAHKADANFIVRHPQFALNDPVLFDVVEQYNYAKAVPLTPIHAKAENYTDVELGADEPNTQSVFKDIYPPKKVINYSGLSTHNFSSNTVGNYRCGKINDSIDFNNLTTDDDFEFTIDFRKIGVLLTDAYGGRGALLGHLSLSVWNANSRGFAIYIRRVASNFNRFAVHFLYRWGNTNATQLLLCRTDENFDVDKDYKLKIIKTGLDPSDWEIDELNDIDEVLKTNPITFIDGSYASTLTPSQSIANTNGIGIGGLYPFTDSVNNGQWLQNTLINSIKLTINNTLKLEIPFNGDNNTSVYTDRIGTNDVYVMEEMNVDNSGYFNNRTVEKDSLLPSITHYIPTFSTGQKYLSIPQAALPYSDKGFVKVTFTLPTLLTDQHIFSVAHSITNKSIFLLYYLSLDNAFAVFYRNGKNQYTRAFFSLDGTSKFTNIQNDQIYDLVWACDGTDWILYLNGVKFKKILEEYGGTGDSRNGDWFDQINSHIGYNNWTNTPDIRLGSRRYQASEYFSDVNLIDFAIGDYPPSQYQIIKWFNNSLFKNPEPNEQSQLFCKYIFKGIEDPLGAKQIIDQSQTGSNATLINYTSQELDVNDPSYIVKNIDDLR